jgi:Fe-S-cluster containining protein
MTSAGEFASWLRETKRTRLQLVDSDVPCGECSACCRASMFIHVGPDELDTLRHIPKRLLFPAPGAPKGHRLMGFNERGECPMLQHGKCSIYAHRPRTCRDFDCRIFAATGIAPEPHAEIVERARSWQFELSSDESRAQLDAVRAAAAFLREQRDRFPAGTLPSSPVQLAVLALRIYEIFAKTTAQRAPSEIAREVLAALKPQRDATRRSRLL